MKKIYRVLILALTFGAFSGCDDELDLGDPNNLTTVEFWQNQQQAIEGTNAIYTALIIDGYYMRMIPSLTDGRGDDIQQDTPWPDLAQVANFNVLSTSGPVLWLWHAHYQAIFRANQVLERVPNIEMDEALKNRLLGQALFLRGLSYFNLAANFKVVPVITTPPKGPDEYFTETATEEALWAQIISDFTEAKELLPVTYRGISGPDAGQIGRATKGAATGMLGKAYLYRENWAAAASAFEEVIQLADQGIYGLMPNYFDNFSPLTENNRESLFEVQFGTSDQVGGTIMNYGGDPTSNWRQVSSVGHTYAMDGYGYSDFLPTRWLYNEYKEERTVNGNLDPRLFATIVSYEPEAGLTTVYDGQPWENPEDAIYPSKYTHARIPGFSSESQGSVELSDINYRVLRYADVLLMYAEALNELGQTDQAYQYIQQVRDRVNLPDLRETMPNMSQAQMREQIAHERALELAIESVRIHDIIRWGWLYDADKLAELRAHDPEFLNWTPGREYLPIPQTELDVNPNLLPNPAN
jgi:tetratricopeptide (TPR) repeat protein